MRFGSVSGRLPVRTAAVYLSGALSDTRFEWFLQVGVR
jgi:hypothetical protein